jgi:CBS domain-containing protein
MLIRDVVSAKPAQGVRTIEPGATVRDLVAALAEYNVGALVVSNDGTTIGGIVSERDIVRRMATSPAVLDLTVADIMTTDVHTCTPSDSCEELMQRMTDLRVRHVPVVEDDRLWGLVSIGDVVKNRIGELEFERDQLDHYVSSSQT